MQKALDELRARDDVRWTYVSPAADFQAEGESTGTHRLGGEELMVGSHGPTRTTRSLWSTSPSRAVTCASA